PPPVLAYDNLPAHSGVTVRLDDDGTLTIQVPPESVTDYLRWAVRSPRLWTLMIIIWLSQSWFTLWQSFRDHRSLFAPHYRLQLMGPTIAAAIGFVVGAIILSRQSATIRMGRNSLSIRRAGVFAPRPQTWGRSLIRDLR